TVTWTGSTAGPPYTAVNITISFTDEFGIPVTFSFNVTDTNVPIPAKLDSIVAKIAATPGLSGICTASHVTDSLVLTLTGSGDTPFKVTVSDPFNTSATVGVVDLTQ